MSGPPHIDTWRSPLGRARGLGSARFGSHHWSTTRLQSMALVPLTLWFIFSMIHMLGAPQEAFIVWLSAPVNLVFMLILIVITFQHMNLGLQNVIEDYVHQEPHKAATMVLIKVLCVLLGMMCVVSALKVGL